MPPAVPELLIEWDRRRREGTPVSLEELCAGRPNDLAVLRVRALQLERCDRLLGLTAPPPAPPDPVPERIGEYEIQGLLGRGGMGVVYRGWDPGLRRAAAVKVLRPTTAYRPFVRSGEVRARFDRECEVLGRLDHGHIVPVYGTGVSDDRPYIAMALVVGGSVADRAEELTRRGPRAVAEFVAKVAQGVHAAHDLGVLHRDLKPANILLTAKGEPRVSDFGLAKFWSPDGPDAEEVGVTGWATEPRSPELTFPGVQPGTPAYMAPEQFDPTVGRIGPATDVWALGVVLFELVAGRRPFAVADDSSLADQVCRTRTPRCRSPHGRVPAWLRVVLGRCLAKDPADRYASAAELAEALRAGLRTGRRRAWALGTVGVLALVLAAGFVGGRMAMGTPADVSPPEPPRSPTFPELPEVRNALKRLRDGEEVVLVGEGARAPYRWVWDEQSGREVTRDGQPFSIFSRWTGPTPVEFLPALPPGRFRIRARLRHDTAGDFSRVALYAGGQSWKSGEGENLSCTWLEFADQGSLATDPPPKGKTGNSRALLRMIWLADLRRQDRSPEGRPSIEMRYAGQILYQSAWAAKRPSDFRTIELVVGGGAIEGRWENDRVGAVADDTMNQFVGECRLRHRIDGTGEPTTGGGTGSVGLVVYNGQVSVQELRIIPITE